MTFLISPSASVTFIRDGSHVRSPRAASWPAADNDPGPAPIPDAARGARAGAGAGLIGTLCLTAASFTTLALLAPIRRLLRGGDPWPRYGAGRWPPRPRQ